MPVIVIAANLLNFFQRRRAHQLRRLVKSHTSSFPLEKLRKCVLHSFLSWIPSELNTNEAKLAISSFSVLTLKLAFLASCSSLQQLFYFIYYEAGLLPGRELWVALLPSQQLCVGW